MPFARYPSAYFLRNLISSASIDLILLDIKMSPECEALRPGSHLLTFPVTPMDTAPRSGRR